MKESWSLRQGGFVPKSALRYKLLKGPSRAIIVLIMEPVVREPPARARCHSITSCAVTSRREWRGPGNQHAIGVKTKFVIIFCRVTPRNRLDDAERNRLNERTHAGDWFWSSLSQVRVYEKRK